MDTSEQESALTETNVVAFAPRPKPARGHGPHICSPSQEPALAVDGFYLDPQTGDLTLHLRDAEGNIIALKYDLRDWSGPKSFKLSLLVEFWQGWRESSDLAR